MTIELALPFAGAWQVRNSPADRVPSHGTTRFASAHAIDFVPVGGDQRTAALTWRSLLRPEPPEHFPGFGRAIVSPVDGEVVAAHDGEPDHEAHRGLPSLGYALTQGRRAAAGWLALAGNHVMIRCEGCVVALCHLQHGSVTVALGERVRTGQPVARCGNSGNSPADRVPSHGTTRFASAHAIDFVPVGGDQRTAALTWRSLLRPEPPEHFPGFGRAIVSPVDGEVVAAHDGEPDHEAHRGLPSLGYALTQSRRAAAGWPALAGNHVMIRCEGGVVVLCHLQHGSVTVALGERVRTGQPVARCGNSGNSTEPHVHVQAIDRLPVDAASAVPMTFRGRLPRNGEIVGG